MIILYDAKPAEGMSLRGLFQLTGVAMGDWCNCIECVGYQPEPEYCTRCGGSGEVMVLVDGGPDAYEVPGCCEYCGGTGVVPDVPV